MKMPDAVILILVLTGLFLMGWLRTRTLLKKTGEYADKEKKEDRNDPESNGRDA